MEGPRAIEVTAFRPKAGLLHIYLLNIFKPNFPLSLTRQEIRSFFHLEEVLPVHDVTIRYHDFKLRSTRLPLSTQAVELQGNAVRVRRLYLHEVLVLYTGIAKA